MTGWSAVATLVAITLALPPTEPQLLDLDGRAVSPFAGTLRTAFVFVFTRTDCPASNRYAPELARLHERFAPRGAAFTLVYPGHETTATAIRRHTQEYGYPFAPLRDPDFSFVDMVGATITPEAAVFDAGGTLRYLGRIDDRYISAGRPRPTPTRHDLEEALESILGGRHVPAERTRAIGCLIDDLR
jgi:AhpC/TSA family